MSSVTWRSSCQAITLISWRLYIFYFWSVEIQGTMSRLYSLCRACQLRRLNLVTRVSQFHSSSAQGVYLGSPDELLPRVGPKRRKKVQEAQDQWDEKAKRIVSGKEPSMLKILEDRGYIKEIAG